MFFEKKCPRWFFLYYFLFKAIGLLDKVAVNKKRYRRNVINKPLILTIRLCFGVKWGRKTQYV